MAMTLRERLGKSSIIIRIFIFGSEITNQLFKSINKNSLKILFWNVKSRIMESFLKISKIDQIGWAKKALNFNPLIVISYRIESIYIGIESLFHVKYNLLGNDFLFDTSFEIFELLQGFRWLTCM